MTSGNGSFKAADSSSATVNTAEAAAASRAQAVEEMVRTLPPLSDNQIAALEQRIRALQQRAGHLADYDTWIASVTPADLE
jgi:hypothetical protein